MASSPPVVLVIFINLMQVVVWVEGGGVQVGVRWGGGGGGV